jgi:drug/metabolite transporter (DMT)-like permease
METTQASQNDTAQILPKNLMIGLSAATTVVMWASAFVGIRAALPAYGPYHLAVLRFITAMIVMLIAAVLLKVRMPQRRDYGRILLIGFLGMTGYNLALNTGQLDVSAGVASLLVNTGPIWTVLLAQVMLGERLPWRGYIGIAVGFAGAVAIALGPDSSISWGSGAFLVLLAALQLSLYSIIQKPLLTRYRPIEVSTYAIITGGLMLLPFGWGLPQTIANAPLAATLSAIFLGVGPAALAYGTWSVVLNNMPASRAASFQYLVPPSALIIAWLWLGEVPSITTLIGGAIALLGVIIVARSRQNPANKPA